MFGRKKKPKDDGKNAKDSESNDSKAKDSKPKDSKNDKRSKKAKSGFASFKKPKYKVTSAKKICHESGLILEKKDSLIRDFKITCPGGDGWLVFTRFNTYIVIKKKGVIMFLRNRQLIDVNAKGSNLTIMWSERQVDTYDYTVKVLERRIDEAVDMFVTMCPLDEARYVHIPEEERESIRRSRIEAQRARVRALEDEMAELRKRLGVLLGELKPGNPDKPEGTKRGEEDREGPKPAYVTEGEAIIKRIDEISSVMERERANLYFASFDAIQRSPLIPEHVENKDVWYDAYYDAKHDAYVQVGNILPTNEKFQKLRKDMKLEFGCGLSPYPASMVEMVFGQPAVKWLSKMVSFNAPAWRAIPKISIENYHYLRSMATRSPRFYGNYFYSFITNSSRWELFPKEHILINKRTGRTIGWADPASTQVDVAILEDELQLAREGSVNHTSLALDDTPYADGEHISCIPKPYGGAARGNDMIGYVINR